MSCCDKRCPQFYSRITPTDGVDTGLDGTPGDTVVDNGPTTTPDNENVADSGTVSEDQSGLVDDSGVISQVGESVFPGEELKNNGLP